MTPACAGTTAIHALQTTKERDDPRVCGDDTRIPATLAALLRH